MYTSAAPWDPAFWLVHPAADRLLQLRRLVATRGNPAYALDESWGYTHDDAAPSDTGVVCDWSEADADSSELAVPTCAKGTCAGHGGADVLPMRIDGVDGPMTNLEFYKYMSPLNDAMPYVYDSFRVLAQRRGEFVSTRTAPECRNPAPLVPHGSARRAGRCLKSSWRARHIHYARC